MVILLRKPISLFKKKKWFLRPSSGVQKLPKLSEYVTVAVSFEKLEVSHHQPDEVAMPMALNHFSVSKHVPATTHDSLSLNYYFDIIDRVMLGTNF